MWTFSFLIKPILISFLITAAQKSRYYTVTSPIYRTSSLKRLFFGVWNGTRAGDWSRRWYRGLCCHDSLFRSFFPVLTVLLPPSAQFFFSPQILSILFCWLLSQLLQRVPLFRICDPRIKTTSLFFNDVSFLCLHYHFIPCLTCFVCSDWSHDYYKRMKSYCEGTQWCTLCRRKIKWTTYNSTSQGSSTSDGQTILPGCNHKEKSGVFALEWYLSDAGCQWMRLLKLNVTKKIGMELNWPSLFAPSRGFVDRIDLRYSERLLLLYPLRDLEWDLFRVCWMLQVQRRFLIW